MRFLCRITQKQIVLNLRFFDAPQFSFLLCVFSSAFRNMTEKSDGGYWRWHEPGCGWEENHFSIATTKHANKSTKVIYYASLSVRWWDKSEIRGSLLKTIQTLQLIFSINSRNVAKLLYQAVVVNCLWIEKKNHRQR